MPQVNGGAHGTGAWRWAGAAALALGIGRTACAADVYLAPDDFVRSAFGGQAPAPSVLWPGAALQKRMQAVLGHPYKQLRIRYWRAGTRTAWVLDEVGKDEEITIGFVLAGEAIERTDVLVFRESRGWEVRFPAYTGRYAGLRLTPADELDRPIDGITGATLSVAAYQRLARLALMLHLEATGHAR